MYDYVRDVEWKECGEYLISEKADIVIGKNLLVRGLFSAETPSTETGVFDPNMFFVETVREFVKSQKNVHDIFGYDYKSVYVELDLYNNKIRSMKATGYFGDELVFEGLRFNFYDSVYCSFRKNSTLYMTFYKYENKLNASSLEYVEKKKGVAASASLSSSGTCRDAFTWISNLALRESLVNTFSVLHPDLKYVIIREEYNRSKAHQILNIYTKQVTTMGTIHKPYVISIFGWPFRDGVYSFMIDMRKEFDLTEKNIEKFKEYPGVSKVKKRYSWLLEDTEVPDGWELGYDYSKKQMIVEKNGVRVGVDEKNIVIEGEKTPIRASARRGSDEGRAILMSVFKDEKNAFLL